MARPKVLIGGAGFGGLECARKLAGAPVDVLLVDRNNYHLFTPLLYQVASALLNPGDIAQPVRSIIRERAERPFPPGGGRARLEAPEAGRVAHVEDAVGGSCQLSGKPSAFGLRRG